MFTNKAQDQWLRKWLPLLTIFLIFFVYWYYFAIAHPIEIWTPNEDAPIMGFAQAVNIDFWFRTPGHRALSQAQYYQPGLPFQFVSWMLYRLAYLGQTSSPVDLFKLSIQHPEPFWLGMQMSALLLSFVSCFFIWKKAIQYGIATAIAATLIFYCSKSACHYGFSIFWNESFTLLFAIIYFFTALSFLRADKSRRWIWLFASGIAAGFLYLHKMNYFVWSIALLPAIFAEVLLNPKSWKKALFYSVVYLVTSLTVIRIFGRLSLGSLGFKKMVDAHKDIFFSSGVYGTGPKTIINLKAMMLNVTNLWTHEKSLFLLVSLFLMLGLFYLIVNWRRREWLQANLPELVLLTTATVVMALALIKHFQPHYTVAVAAVLPFWIFWLARNQYKSWIYLSIPIILLGIHQGTYSNFFIRANDLLAQKETQADEKAILSMPMEPGEVRLWVYRYIAPTFQRLFIINFSGLTTLQQYANQVQGPQYFASPWVGKTEFEKGLTDIKDMPWRYFVIEKHMINTYLDWEIYSWLKSPLIKKTELRRTVIFENLSPHRQTSLS